MKFPIGSMTVGDVLDRGQKLLFARFPLLFGVSLLVQLPALLLQLLLPFLAGRGALGASLAVMGVALLSALILTPIAQAVIVYVVTQEYIDRPTTLGQAFGYAFARFGSLLGSVILAGLITFVGLLLFCIPGIYLSIAYAFVGQVVVLESLSGMDALNRSRQLVQGFWWRVFGTMFLIQIATLVLNFVINFGLERVLPAQQVVPTDNPFAPAVRVNEVNQAIHTLVLGLVAALMGAYVAVCTTLLYLDLRIRKEGFDLEMEARKEGAETPPPAL